MVNYHELITTGGIDLYIVKERGKNGYYAESLDNGTVKYLSDLAHNVTFLIDEKMPTYNNHMSIRGLFNLMETHQGSIPKYDAPKEEVKSFFRLAVPNYNEKRILIKTLRKYLNYFCLIKKYKNSKRETESLFIEWQMGEINPIRTNKHPHFA